MLIIRRIFLALEPAVKERGWTFVLCSIKRFRKSAVTPHNLRNHRFTTLDNVIGNTEARITNGLVLIAIVIH